MEQVTQSPVLAVLISSENWTALMGKALDQCPAILMALASLVVALRAKREAREAARKQIHFALESAVNSGAISAPDSSPLRSLPVAADATRNMPAA